MYSRCQQAIPVLKKAYGDSLGKVLHVGPDTCSVVSKLLNEEEMGAWGVEPYDIEDAENYCKGLVPAADIKFTLTYRPKSLSPRYLNKALLDLERVSSDGVVIYTGSPGQQRAKIAEVSKFGRPAKLRSAS